MVLILSSDYHSSPQRSKPNTCQVQPRITSPLSLYHFPRTHCLTSSHPITMKLAISSLMLLAITTVIALPTPEQATPNSCIIPKGEVDGSIEKRGPSGLDSRPAKEASCIIYNSEVDGSIEKRCPIGLEARSEEEAGCIFYKSEVDGSIEKRCPPSL